MTGWCSTRAPGSTTASGVYNNASTYAHALGLKDSTTHTWAVPSASTRTETYGYEPDYDWLTSTNYGDGTATNTWGYDVAGNRISASAQPGTWSYDNLNRILTSPMGSYTHDILGNRTVGVNASSYSGWDEVNRMSYFGNPQAPTYYVYRADGMRVKKTLPSSAGTSRYYYDGQMPVEDDTVVAGNTTVTRNLCGARGIDAISQTTTSGTTWAFPVYDGHGNMVGTLARGTGTTFTIGNRRDYDVWGAVRSGAGTGAPNNRYCANLGHVQDDESSLVYMRARYYEPGTGRFITQDSDPDTVNWYLYCGQDPVNGLDNSGHYKVTESFIWGVGELVGWTFAMLALIAASAIADPLKSLTTVASCLAVSVAGFAIALGYGTNASLGEKMGHALAGLGGAILRALTAIAINMKAATWLQYGVARAALTATLVHDLILLGALMNVEEVDG